MTALLVALIVGFLLGILLMVLLVSGRHEDELVDRLEQREREKDLTDAKRET